MRALVIRHDHLSLSGPVGDRIAQLGYEIDELLVVPAERYDSPGVECDFPDPAGYDLVVLLGAPWSVYDRASVAPWIDGELELLRTAYAAELPVLGICFGAQALATALGGSVEAAPRQEIGWTAVESDVPGLIPAGPWFQWHFDRFTVPPGAVELARSAVGPQAFRAGRALGVQFHPELDEETLLQWLDAGGRAEARAHGEDPEQLLAETRARHEESRQRAYDLVDAFLARIAGVTADPAAAGQERAA
ncbi:type 1 glutamine amidotransferase [Streptomyces turgidiscabies]|uniref:Class I glutamine amidotransferase n=1 Tax=Streptomyces turgidiscabies (strain Car8) TaxID=698760 RepID=L7FA77_STRT8|nr:type 1 glutamine amidotransferase [Streptomyces turgidiscabies]ELP68508.1 class I glutamine amidotransferase [Streptomyces turgidiscabies Car8]MDX3494137.1 type 1 glutamine amidotransferase [Streptomyces turgidiscabies]GAQ68492.1 GMP synthase [glutamine-hydrolyzing] [Streptomyces turgidiscabies]